VKLLEVFCGRGGWSKPFLAAGWDCVGVDLVDLGYPGRLIVRNALDLEEDFVRSFDAVVASPPCEEFARACLPWLRCDGVPAEWALQCLAWSLAWAEARPKVLVECSAFAARYAPGSVGVGSFRLWGDVPLLVSVPPRTKSRMSGKRPDLRGEIPWELGNALLRWWS